MKFLAIALLCVTIVSGSTSDDDILYNMTPGEIWQIFHTDIVPKYEFVKVHFSEKLHKRDLSARRRLHIKAFGENIAMWLYPGNSVLAGQDTPVYYSQYSGKHPENVEFLRWNGSMEIVEHIYGNPSWRASFLITMRNVGNARVNGYIGSRRLVVRSLPPRVAEEYRRRRRSVTDDNDIDLPLHVVFQMSENIKEDSPVQRINATAMRRRIARSHSGNIPDTLYPEILIFVDYSMWRPYDGDMYSILEYILAFINGVDLKFRSMADPKIRFHVSGIVIARDRRTTPFIWDNALGHNVFDSNKAMQDATKFFYGVKDTFPFDSYDIAVTMTSQDFGVNDNKLILGRAKVAAACQRDDHARTLESLTIIKDTGVFDSVHVAAHEIGHLIGATHDDNSTGENCLYSNGYLMAEVVWHTQNSADFSTCSIDEIYETLQKDNLDCLLNPPPSAGKRLREFMPGRVVNLEEQCKFLGLYAPCQNPKEPTDICVNIFCKNPHDTCIKTGTAALDGTLCGDKKFCLHMKCVSF